MPSTATRSPSPWRAGAPGAHAARSPGKLAAPVGGAQELAGQERTAGGLHPGAAPTGRRVAQGSCDPLRLSSPRIQEVGGHARRGCRRQPPVRRAGPERTLPATRAARCWARPGWRPARRPAPSSTADSFKRACVGPPTTIRSTVPAGGAGARETSRTSTSTRAARPSATARATASAFRTGTHGRQGLSWASPPRGSTRRSDDQVGSSLVLGHRLCQRPPALFGGTKVPCPGLRRPGRLPARPGREAARADGEDPRLRLPQPLQAITRAGRQAGANVPLRRANGQTRQAQPGRPPGAAPPYLCVS